MQSEGHRAINNTIIQKMGKIENITGKMFHEAVSKEFELECIVATDSTNLGFKNIITRRLNTIIDDFEFKKTDIYEEFYQKV